MWRAQPAVCIPPFPNGPHYACRHIPLQAESYKNNLGRNSESGWMLSSGEDKPGCEALLLELELSRLMLAWLPLVGRSPRLGRSQSQIQFSLTEEGAFIHTGSEENSSESNGGLQYRSNTRETEHKDVIK